MPRLRFAVGERADVDAVALTAALFIVNADRIKKTL
jgi:hypothetical protein